MGRQWAESLPAARALFDRAGQVLGYDLAELCFNGPADRLDTTVHSQPALLVASLAALEVLKDRAPDVVEACGAAAGLSLGEYTALVFAGAIQFDDALRLVGRRGEAMQAAADALASGMVSVLGMERDALESLCREAARGDVLQVANLLCPGNIVVSGTKDGCARLASLAEQAGAMKVVPLAVAGAFHTPIMEPARKPRRRSPGRAFQSSRTSTRCRTTIPTKSANCWSGRSSRRSAGKTRSGGCWGKASIGITRSAPVGCCAA
jgi:[acyl-carrier-protein] S-malonyltransferase